MAASFSRSARGLSVVLAVGAAVARAADCGTPGLRLNHAQVLATHNSYHVAPDPFVTSEWNYTHPPLDVQLSRGVRSFELDVFWSVDDNQLRVLHVLGSDPETTCETLEECFELAKGCSDRNLQHFPLHFYVDVIGGFQRSEDSTTGCMYSDVEAIIPCVVSNCGQGNTRVDGIVACVSSNCLGDVIAILGKNSACSSLLGCLSSVEAEFGADYMIQEADVVPVVQGCTSTVTDQVVDLNATQQQAALAAVRAAMDASFPASRRIPPEEVQETSGVFTWPEVDSSRGKAMFYVNTAASWGSGNHAGYYFGRGGAMTIQNVPSDIEGVEQGQWVRTRVDVDVQLDAARQAAGLASGAQVLSTDFPPTVLPEAWAGLGEGSGSFWIPGGQPVRCNPVTVPDGQECSALALEGCTVLSTPSPSASPTSAPTAATSDPTSAPTQSPTAAPSASPTSGETQTTTTLTETHTALRAKVVSTSASVEVDDPAAFAANPSVTAAFTTAYAKLAGVSEDLVTVTVTADRRLHQGRQLAGSVTVSVEIMVVSSSSDPTAADDVVTNLEAATTTALASEATTELANQGVTSSIAVQAVEAPSVTEITQTATSTSVTATTDNDTPSEASASTASTSNYHLLELLAVMLTTRLLC